MVDETSSYDPFRKTYRYASVLATTQIFREPPRKRIFQEDLLDSFRIYDKINSLENLNQSHSPPGFAFRQFEGCVIFYRLKNKSIK